MGVYLVPQQSAGFKYSGNRYFDDSMPSAKYHKFTKETGLILHPGCGIDSFLFKDDWNRNESTRGVCTGRL